MATKDQMEGKQPSVRDDLSRALEVALPLGGAVLGGAAGRSFAKRLGRNGKTLATLGGMNVGLGMVNAAERQAKFDAAKKRRK